MTKLALKEDEGRRLARLSAIASKSPAEIDALVDANPQAALKLVAKLAAYLLRKELGR